MGVLKEYRSNGVASFMLGNLLSHLRSGDHRDVRAVYLHVLTTNNAAICFYEHRGFKPHLFLPYYYNIKGKRVRVGASPIRDHGDALATLDLVCKSN